MDGEPRHPDTPYQLGRILAVQGDHAEAARMFIRAEELGEGGTQFANAIGRGVRQLIMLNRIESAAQVAREIVRLRPEDDALREELAPLLELDYSSSGG